MIRFFVFITAFCLCTLSGVGDNFGFSTENSSSAAVTEDISREETISGAEGEEPTEEAIELTKEEILTRIKTMSEYHPDIVALVPGLKAITGAEGSVTYEYNGKPLDTQDRDTLFGVLRIVNSHVSWKNVERTQRQLRNLRQIENQNRTDRMLRQQRQQNKR